jgi:hypothetical protein
MSEELRQVRDTLIEALRRSDTLTVEGRALFRRYAAMSEALTGTAPVGGPVQAGPVAGPVQAGPMPAGPVAARPAVPGMPPAQAAPAVRRRPEPEEDDEFGGSFMVRPNAPQPAPPSHPPAQQPPADLPRSLRERRR